jgi:primase-polymerase (primpol)-like protein
LLASDDGLIGLDLDGCRDPGNGRPDPWAADILGKFGDTYAEVSPSGTGYHIFIAGRLLAGMGKRFGGIEVYVEARYITLGLRLDDHPIVVAPAGDRLE